MAYSDFYLKRRGFKIPSVLGLIVVFVTIFFLAKYAFINTSRISHGAEKTIKNLLITNKSPTQVTIFWQTDTPSTGWILYGQSDTKLTQIALDERDFEKNKQSFINHYVTIKNLTSGSPYYFKIVVANELFGPLGDKSYQFTTLDKTSKAATLEPAYGKLISQSGVPIKDAIVILNVKDAYPLSTLSKASGEWLIPLNYIIDKKSDALKVLSETDSIQLAINTETGEKTTVQTTVANMHPLTTVTVGQNKTYDFTSQEQVLSTSTSTQSQTQSSQPKIDIVFPQPNAVIPGTSPLIKGTALPGSPVALQIISGTQIIKSTIMTDTKGQWRLAITKDLTPGKYTLNMLTQDSNQNAVKKSQNFTIEKSGEQVLAESTGSATPTATPTRTPTPTPTSSLSVNAATVSLTPTSVATATPIATTSAAPVSGPNINPYLIGGLSFIVLGIGLLIVF